MKMDAGLLLLVCAGAVLYSAQAQDSYDGLPDDYKKGVDLVLEQFNTRTSVEDYFRFMRSLDKSDIESGFGVKYIYHHFYVKPTTCTKLQTVLNPESCPFRNDRSAIDCAVCYKTAADQIESIPNLYVHCVLRLGLTQVIRKTRREHCKNISSNSGAPTEK